MNTCDICIHAPNLNRVGWVEEWFHAISSRMIGWRVTPKQSILSPNLGRLPSGIKHGWLANPTNWMEVVMGKSSTNGDFRLQCLIAGGYTLIYVAEVYCLLSSCVCQSAHLLLNCYDSVFISNICVFIYIYIHQISLSWIYTYTYTYTYTYIYICNNNDRACSQIFVSSSSLISLKYTWISFIFCFTF